jgi:hypothetical protein
MVAHIYNPSYAGGKGRKIAVQVQMDRTKSMRPYLKNN